jgi:hypothetical protein
LFTDGRESDGNEDAVTLEVAEDDDDGGAGEADADTEDPGPVTRMLGLLLLVFGSNKSVGNGTCTEEPITVSSI